MGRSLKNETVLKEPQMVLHSCGVLANGCGHIETVSSLRLWCIVFIVYIGCGRATGLLEAERSAVLPFRVRFRV